MAMDKESLNPKKIFKPSSTFIITTKQILQFLFRNTFNPSITFPKFPITHLTLEIHHNRTMMQHDDSFAQKKKQIKSIIQNLIVTNTMGGIRYPSLPTPRSTTNKKNKPQKTTKSKTKTCSKSLPFWCEEGEIRDKY